MALPNFLKLKAVLLSEDAGKNWIIVRQHYLTDAENHFRSESVQGMKLKATNGDQINGQTKEIES